MDNIVIIDDFLSKETFLNVKNNFNANFPWYFIETKVNDPYNDQILEIYNCQFIHIFYDDFRITSNFYQSIAQPIVDVLKPMALIRIKANLTLATSSIIKYGLHTDFDNSIGKTSVYYLNDNNGKTIFEDGSEIESVSNRMVIFPSHLRHTGTSSTDSKNRLVMNFNFIWDR